MYPVRVESKNETGAWKMQLSMFLKSKVSVLNPTVTRSKACTMIQRELPRDYATKT